MSIAGFVSVVMLLPLSTDPNRALAWSAPWSRILEFPTLVLIVCLVVVTSVFTIPPVIRELRSYPILAIGIITVSFAFANYPELGLGSTEILYFPGFVALFVLVMAGFATSMVGLIIALPVAAMLKAVWAKSEKHGDRLEHMAMVVFCTFFGLLPVLAYAGWLGTH
jgi:hypothetical protein